MASEVDIANIALAHVGDDAVISSINPPDGSVQAGHCARFYPIARRAMIEAGPWTFALARSELAAVTNPSTTWAYAFALPATCIKPLRILSASTTSAVTMDGIDDSGGSGYHIEGRVIYTHEPEAVLVYKQDVTDSSRFTPNFTLALGYMLGSFIAGPIVKGMEGVRLGQSLYEMATRLASIGATLDANSSGERVDQMPSSIRARQ